MTEKVTAALMFIGCARDALALYQQVFKDMEVTKMDKYGDDDGDMAGHIKLAELSFGGQSLIIQDSPPVHDFTFTPSFSLYTECMSENDLVAKAEALSKDGKTLMPIDDYGFSKKFTWVEDRFGVSWQLNLV